ncbi:hypothetical protein CYMTET_12480 [Cymbomonas tetramitiformis]|uniref:Uncharacterized protein n=1 Tax=Cymbomonas tetramitiformis TaxID=36881 RepID=A0AAE0LC49_9CHLO|nr:hypothetical protein CYMTET_12480 [Cymbomonas tetramitiformis]
MDTRRKLLKESDLNSSSGLLDAHALGDDYFNDTTEVSKFAKVIVALKAEIPTAGLDPHVFDLDQPTLGVKSVVNEIVYDTLTCIIESDFVAYGYQVDSDSASDRDGRRALIDLMIIKGYVPPAVRQKLQAEVSALVYPARVVPRQILVKE